MVLHAFRLLVCAIAGFPAGQGSVLFFGLHVCTYVLVDVEV